LLLNWAQINFFWPALLISEPKWPQGGIFGRERPSTAARRVIMQRRVKQSSVGQQHTNSFS
jgi:hypothetical protein